jgi:hypothetical protein
MSKVGIYKATLIAAAVLLICVSARMQSLLNVERADLGLTRLTPLENAPPVLAFTSVALGGFRGLIANMLWIRANDLQQDDKYFEMVQLADWITKLEPHFVAVWTVQAWNMAYNISVKFKDPEDRWHWVERGVQLLRDKALPMNPGETLIYRDLSWLFQHKIGQNLDDAHMTYKLHLAEEMQPVLGGRPDFDALLNPKTPEDKARLHTLVTDFKMDPKLIKEVDDEYGPLDWRLPDAHAIYWAELGRRKSTSTKNAETLRRSIYQSMQSACIRGGALDRSVTNVTPRNFMLWPNLELVGKVSASYEKLMAEEDRESYKGNIQTAHKNFLKQAIALLYEDDKLKQAAYWFNYLKTTYTNAFVLRQANISLDDFCLSQIVETEGEADMNKVSAAIFAMYNNGFECLVRDDDDRYLEYETLARRMWEFYKNKIGDFGKQRLALHPLNEMRQRVLEHELDPDPQNAWMPPGAQAVLRTKLGLPPPGAAPPPPANNVPSAAPESSTTQ